jgi:PHS family inorganic phosphate transporter-like MFS transporter
MSSSPPQQQSQEYHNKYGSFVGQEFSIDLLSNSIEMKDSDTMSTFPGSASSTIASADSDALLDRFSAARQDRELTSNQAALGRRDSLLDTSFRLLGFSSNPVDSSGDGGNSRNTAAADMRLAMLSNFSTAYNTINISMALLIMHQVYPNTNVHESSLCSSALIAGMIVGQLLGGTLGDALGRHRAMTVVMFLQVISAFGSAFSTELNLGGVRLSLYAVLALWRFVCGVGCGGNYPLAAAMSAETSNETDGRGKLVALTFSMQGFAYLLGPVLAWFLVSTLGESSDFAWRLLLGLGCVPGVVLTVLRLRHQRLNRSQMRKNVQPPSIEKTISIDDIRHAPVSIVDAILMEPNLIRKLIGTAGCWLLFDILFYGNTLFQPVVLSAAFGTAETIAHAARDTAILALLALPGYIVSIAAVGRQTPRYIQSQGFLAMAVLYTIIGLYFDALADQRVLLLLMYGCTGFYSNYGPNSTVSNISLD